mmetsp:Transcript_39439/g.68352  ORF Transcript_39439/g.68352 Transcript_39439/m.68352 type:complete len:97 (-) Transcript_39439:316-606(-)
MIRHDGNPEAAAKVDVKKAASCRQKQALNVGFVSLREEYFISTVPLIVLRFNTTDVADHSQRGQQFHPGPAESCWRRRKPRQQRCQGQVRVEWRHW